VELRGDVDRRADRRAGDEQVTSVASAPASKVEPTRSISRRIVGFSSTPAAIVFLIRLSSTK
jgi:hypothetical protein